MVKQVVDKMKGKTSGTISITALLGMLVQGYLGYQENKTKSAQQGFTYQVVRELKNDNDRALEKLDDMLERLSRLEGRTDGLKDAVEVLQDRKIQGAKRSEAVQKILETIEAPPEVVTHAVESGAIFEGETGVEVDVGEGGGGGGADEAAEAPRRKKSRRSLSATSFELPAKLPGSVKEIEQVQQQMQRAE